MSFNWSAGTSSFSILGIMTNCDLSESTLTLNSSPPRVTMSSLVQLWYPRRYLGISYKVAEKKNSAYWKQVDIISKMKTVFGYKLDIIPVENERWGLQPRLSLGSHWTRASSYRSQGRGCWPDWLGKKNWILNIDMHWHIKTYAFTTMHYLLSLFLLS